LIHSESDVAYDTGVSESRPTSPVGSLKMLPVEVATELNEAVNIIPVVAKLEPKTQKIVKEILTSESHLPWNETLGVYQTKYEEQKKMDVYQTKFKEQKKDEFYNCPIQQSMKICQKFLKSMIRKERKTRQWEDVRSLERKAGLLEKLNGRFSGKNEDLELIKLSREEFNGEDLHSTKTEIVKLLKVLGIDNYEKYKAQYIIWEKYYHNTKRINSPFFDRPLERCGFEARNQEITTIPTAVICRM
jgi:hypothetical protein